MSDVDRGAVRISYPCLRVPAEACHCRWSIGCRFEPGQMRAVIDDDQSQLAVHLAKLEAIEPKSILPAVGVPATRGKGLPFDDDTYDHCF